MRESYELEFRAFLGELLKHYVSRGRVDANIAAISSSDRLSVVETRRRGSSSGVFDRLSPLPFQFLRPAPWHCCGSCLAYLRRKCSRLVCR